MNQRPESAPANVGQPGQRTVRCPVVTEVHYHRSALYGRSVHEPPIAGVRRVVPVVTEDEILPCRNDERSPIVPGRMIVATLVGCWGREIVALPVELRI